MQVLQSKLAACFVVDQHRADGATLQLAANDDGGDIALLHVREQVDIHQRPVRDYNQSLYSPLQQHLEVLLETSAIVMRISEDGHERSLVERILDSADNRRAIRIRDVEDHHAKRVISATAERAGQLI